LIVWICRKLNLSVDSINVIFTDDQTLKKLHRDYLNDDTFTDVITFNLSDRPPIESEIYVSSDRAHENSKQYAVSYQNEIMRLLIHACLHLAGYEDGDANKRKVMKAKEDFFLNEAEKRFKFISPPQHTY
jgi:rRNA maturation RNase YbeY